MALSTRERSAEVIDLILGQDIAQFFEGFLEDRDARVRHGS